MPGIFGVYKERGKEDLSQLIDNMIVSMDNKRELRIDKYLGKEKGIGLGRVSLGVLNSITQPINDPTERCMIIFHGELYNNPGKLSDPEYILSLYMETGNTCASQLNGIFQFAIYDKRYDLIKLFSDKFGLQPLYYSILTDGIIFSAEIKAILKEKNVRKIPDYQSFADFLHYGQILGQKTLFQDIKLLAPGSILTFDLSKKYLSLEQYFQLDDLFVKEGKYNPDVSKEEAALYLTKSIKARSANHNILGLSLSGGLDSRAILAGLEKDAEGMHTYTLGIPGCADQKLAERMARVGKTRHEFVELDQKYLQNFKGMADSMIRLSDGMYHPHESTEMLALEYFKSAEFKILLRGHGGEISKASLAYPVMVTPQVNACSRGSNILEHIFTITNLVTRDNNPGELFTSSFYKKTKDAARQSLDDSCGEASQTLSPADMCIYYYINEHIRRQVVASLEIFRSQIEIRMPYLDDEYLKILLQLPVSQRNRGEIHFTLIQRCMPELMKIPDSNTGAPLDAGHLRLLLTDKFNSLMKKLGVKGFRHYTEFQDWQRTAFKSATEEILFSRKLMDRDIYNPKYVKKIFERHVSGKNNYAHLIGTIVGIELWFQNFVEKES
ncbi:MAG: asparagine synthase-related protein [Candidatus Scalindua sp.]|nr:asparagine synthase-related protein [Candidatus Scalindua sp.]